MYTCNYNVCECYNNYYNFPIINTQVYLILGMLFSIFEDIPNSVVTVIAFKTYDLDNG